MYIPYPITIIRSPLENQLASANEDAWLSTVFNNYNSMRLKFIELCNASAEERITGLSALDSNEIELSGGDLKQAQRFCKKRSVNNPFQYLASF